jgi:SAM-dependent methyltransferase
MTVVVRTRRAGQEYQCVRCDDCGFHYVNPEPTQAELDAFYAAEYQNDHQHVWHGLEDHHNRTVIDTLRRLGVRSLVDLGAGQGRFVHMAREAGIAASGIELAAGNVAAAREHYGLTLQQYTVAGYLATRPRGIENFTILNVLEHSPDPLGIARQMHESLRPGGYVVVIVPDVSFTLTLGRVRSLLGFRDKYMLESKRFGQQGFLPPIHLSSFDAAHLRMLLEKAGFNVVEMRQAPVVGTVKPIMNVAKNTVYAVGRVLELVSGGRIHWGYSLMAVAQVPAR